MNKGPQLTPRWEYTLRFTGQQGALCFDQLQRLLGRLSPDEQAMKEQGVLTEERTRKILRRWASEELFEYRVFYVRQKGWLWLTRKGLRFVDLPLRYYEPSPASLPHLYAVNDIRLMVEERRLQDTWKSERELRAELETDSIGSKRHLPDGEIHTATGIIAVEAELTMKAEKRLHQIVYDLASNPRYKAVWYFTPENVKPAVEKAISTLASDKQRRFTLSDLKGNRYEAAAAPNA